MKPFGSLRLLRHSSLVSLSIAASVALLPAIGGAQSLPTGGNQAQPINPDNPNVLQPTGQDNGLLSMQGGQRLLTEASQSVSAQDYPTALKKLQDARQIFNQLSNFYQDLAGSFSGIDNRIADGNRRKALESAQMRDEATYQLALVHRAQNQPELAVPLLIQIVRSQQPTRDLGKRAYRQLLELGFVDAPFPREQSSSSSR
jgi:hypothetical protein